MVRWSNRRAARSTRSTCPLVTGSKVPGKMAWRRSEAVMGRVGGRRGSPPRRGRASSEQVPEARRARPPRRPGRKRPTGAAHMAPLPRLPQDPGRTLRRWSIVLPHETPRPMKSPVRLRPPGTPRRTRGFHPIEDRRDDRAEAPDRRAATRGGLPRGSPHGRGPAPRTDSPHGGSEGRRPAVGHPFDLRTSQTAPSGPSTGPSSVPPRDAVAPMPMSARSLARIFWLDGAAGTARRGASQRRRPSDERGPPRPRRPCTSSLSLSSRPRSRLSSSAA